MAGNDLVAHLARFSGELRHAGVPVGLRDEIDGAAALRFIDIGDPEEVRLALRSALRIPRRWWAEFDRLFDESWRRAALPHPARDRNGPRAPRRWRGDERTEAPLARIRRELDERTGSREAEAPDADGDLPGYSPRALLRKKVFDECTPDDLRDMERLLERLARRIATRPSRRLVPSERGPVVDVRRSFRRSLAHGGELVELARRARAVELPSLVVLCDTSGSMDACSRFLLAFVFALRKVTRRTEIFAFNTSLTRLTPWLRTGDVAGTLERLARNVERLVRWNPHRRVPARLRRRPLAAHRAKRYHGLDPERRARPRRYRVARDGPAGHPPARPQDHLAEPAHGRPALPPGGERHAGGAAARGPARARPQSGGTGSDPADDRAIDDARQTRNRQTNRNDRQRS